MISYNHRLLTVYGSINNRLLALYGYNGVVLALLEVINGPEMYLQHTHFLIEIIPPDKCWVIKIF